jgi:CheY-like chemotaxis protein
LNAYPASVAAVSTTIHIAESLNTENALELFIEYLVLVVEDDKPIRNLITTTLKMNDYRFITAVRGNEAIMLSASHKPDIIILDLGLPDIDGVEVIEHIRTWSDVPIIIVSARSEERDKITALDKGADDYLTKPFSVDELLARLRVIQRRLMKSENISVTEFVNGRLRIDYVLGCVHLDDEELHMTPLVKNNTRYINKTAPALRTASSDILLLKHCTSFLRLNTVIAESNRTAKVVVFIPPAVEPGEPPISIRITIMAVPDSSIAARSVVLKPAVRVVTD